MEAVGGLQVLSCCRRQGGNKGGGSNKEMGREAIEEGRKESVEESEGEREREKEKGEGEGK